MQLTWKISGAVKHAQVSPDDLALGTVWHTEGEVEAAPPLCCVVEAFQAVSLCIAGHTL